MHPTIKNPQALTILEIAKNTLISYPQYNGYFDGAEWMAIRITNEIRTKCGVAFRKGTITIAKTDGLAWINGMKWQAYSPLTGFITSLDLHDAEPVK